MKVFGGRVHIGRILVTYGDGATRYKYGFWAVGPGQYFEHWEINIEFDPGRPR